MAEEQKGKTKICSDNPAVPIGLRCYPLSSGSEPNRRSTELTYTPCARLSIQDCPEFGRILRRAGVTKRGSARSTHRAAERHGTCSDDEPNASAGRAGTPVMDSIAKGSLAWLKRL